MSKKNQAGGLMLPNFKTYYSNIVTKQVWYWQNNRQIDQWKKDLGNGLLPIELLISDKGAKIIQGIVIVFSTNGIRTGYLHV